MTERPSRSDFEDFLYEEVALLDEWRLDEWFALFAEGASYHVPTAGAPADADPAKSLFYIADDYVRLRERIERLKKKDAHVEFPRSILRHVISNVRIREWQGDVALIACNFITYRAKNGIVDTYFGHSLYRIDCSGKSWKIKSKRSTLDMDLLYPGKVSIVV
jgi:p-cumate 2,3-dioxygenase beta subunit